MRPGGGEPRRAGGFVATRAVLLLAAAVVIGAATLHAFDRGIDPSTISADAGSDTPTTKKPKNAPRAAAVTTTTSTTLPPRPHPEVKILAINGTNTAGVAGRIGDLLRKEGYTNILSPVTGKAAASTTVQFALGRDSDAREVARVLGLSDAAVVPLVTPPPVQDTRGADVIVVVGPDLAERLTPATTPTTARRVTTTTGVRAIPATTTTTRVPATTTTTA